MVVMVVMVVVCVCVCVVATRDTLTTITDEVFGDQSGHQGIQ